jgi:hypothetical protein
LRNSLGSVARTATTVALRQFSPGQTPESLVLDIGRILIR